VFDYSRPPGARDRVTVEVDGNDISAGLFTSDQSAKAALIVDRLRVAAGGKRVNFDEDMLDQVGCLCVMACVWSGV
jgi:hypothetical protein